MAYINYMEVGKEVFVAGIGGVAAGYLHFQFLQPQFAGQQIAGINTATIVDIIVALVIGIATTMYVGPRNKLGMMFGYGLAGTILAIGLLQQFGIIPGGVAARARARIVRTPIGVAPVAVPRAGYLAPSGVVVNKHGTVPEIAPGTFA